MPHRQKPHIRMPYWVSTPPRATRWFVARYRGGVVGVFCDTFSEVCKQAKRLWETGEF